MKPIIYTDEQIKRIAEKINDTINISGNISSGEKTMIKDLRERADELKNEFDLGNFLERLRDYYSYLGSEAWNWIDPPSEIYTEPGIVRAKDMLYITYMTAWEIYSWSYFDDKEKQDYIKKWPDFWSRWNTEDMPPDFTEQIKAKREA